jgi:hypothetical protein
VRRGGGRRRPSEDTWDVGRTQARGLPGRRRTLTTCGSTHEPLAYPLRAWQPVAAQENKLRGSRVGHTQRSSRTTTSQRGCSGIRLSEAAAYAPTDQLMTSIDGHPDAAMAPAWRGLLRLPHDGLTQQTHRDWQPSCCADCCSPAHCRPSACQRHRKSGKLRLGKWCTARGVAW